MRRISIILVALVVAALSGVLTNGSSALAAPVKKTTGKASTAKPVKPAAAKSTVKKAANAKGSRRVVRSRRRGSVRRRVISVPRQSQPTKERYAEIQRALGEKGYLASEANGEWNAESVEALKRFQDDQSIKATGKVNSLSLIALGLGAKHNPLGTLPVIPTAPVAGPESPQSADADEQADSPELITPPTPGLLP